MSVCGCDNFIMYEDGQDEFKMWQGLVGAHYTPYVDANGNLSWTNNGGLPNPATVNIKGAPGTGLEIKGIVASVSDLPSTAASGSVYLVGTEPPYDGYVYADGGWTYIGVVGVGENGRGIVSITKTSTAGLVDTYTITYTDGVNPTTFTVTNGAPGVGVPDGGATGQVLKKASNADYDTEWGAAGEPAIATPLMDGTGAVGTSAKYAREDHVHPTDTSRASQSDMTTVQGDITSLNAFKDTAVMMPQNTIPIPAEGASVTIRMTGLTSVHRIIYWNFSASAENQPPVDLSWTTSADTCVITNNGGTTSESMKPIFAEPQIIAATTA